MLGAAPCGSSRLRGGGSQGLWAEQERTRNSEWGGASAGGTQKKRVLREVEPAWARPRRRDQEEAGPRGGAKGRRAGEVSGPVQARMLRDPRLESRPLKKATDGSQVGD